MDQYSRRLAVILGASWFPKSPRLAAGKAFYNSALDFMEYLTSPKGLSIPQKSVCWLFDDSRAPSDQLEDVSEFLEHNTSSDPSLLGKDPQELILFYVGHGLFARSDRAYCLAVRATNVNNEGATSIRAGDLASVLKENARFMRRFLIFDCCFAGTVYKEFQSASLDNARVQILRELPTKGTSILCSSNARDPSLAPQNLGHTMFSDALLKSLWEGHPFFRSHMSFSEIGDLVKDRLRTTYPDNWVRPEILSPDQREGDISSIPLFPNFSIVTTNLDENAELQERELQEREKAEVIESERQPLEATERQLRERHEREKVEAAERERQKREATLIAERDRLGQLRREAARQEHEREKAEATERERQKREAALIAERDKLDQLRKETARQEHEREKAEAAERERQKQEAILIAERDRLDQLRREAARQEHEQEKTEVAGATEGEFSERGRSTVRKAQSKVLLILPLSIIAGWLTEVVSASIAALFSVTDQSFTRFAYAFFGIALCWLVVILLRRSAKIALNWKNPFLFLMYLLIWCMGWMLGARLDSGDTLTGIGVAVVVSMIGIKFQ